MYFFISNLPSVQSLLAEDHPNLILINRYAMQVFLQRKYLQIHVTSILCWIIGQQTIAERNVEQTKDVHMYIEEFILVDIWIHCCTSWNWICMEYAVVYIQTQQ